MTRYEYLKNASLEEMAEVLCNINDNTGSEDEPSSTRCERCLAYSLCLSNHNGFVDWLNEEVVLTKNQKVLQVWD